MINFSLQNKTALAEQLGRLLIAKQATVATVESCTSGGLAYAITEVAGSSQWFNQSWVTYSNYSKHDLVGVDQDMLEEHGAVSQQVAMQMAEKGATKANADICVAISGIAGPGGGTVNKPVGFVWFAIAGPLLNQAISFNRRFSGDRTEVREQAIVLGLEKLIECLAE